MNRLFTAALAGATGVVGFRVVSGEAGGGGAAARRETVLDRRVHIEKQLLPVPEVAPLCDSLSLDKRRVNIGDCELYCEVEGAGLPLVLINGGPGGTHHGFHPYFGAAAAFTKVVYYDQRGCGQSDWRPEGGYSLDQAVSDLDALRAALDVERWVVLGWSYGGVLAQCYTVRFPEHVAGLVLVGSGTDGLRLKLGRTRQYDYLAPAEVQRMREIRRRGDTPLERLVFNTHLNGDWKRQSFYRPTVPELARMARYEWKHDPQFRGRIGRDLRRLERRGMFDACPLPVLILEGVHDLTWAADKAEKLHKCFPGSRLVLFDRSSHAPFADEPDRFFGVLREFVRELPAAAGAAVAEWQRQIAAQKAARERSPEYIVRRSGWGRQSNASIARQYSPAWLDQLSEPTLLLKVGFALQEAGKRADALQAFERMSELAGGAPGVQGVALTWQGHTLDLMGRREDAIAAYTKASRLVFRSRHDQYELTIGPEYARQRIRTPFTGVDNADAD